MKLIAQTCGDAHEACFDVILNSHSELDIQTHIDKKEFTLEYLSEEEGDDFLHIKILNPEQEPQVSAGSMFDRKKVGAYKTQFTTLTPPRADGNGAVYTYWNRAADYPFPKAEFNDIGDRDLWSGDGRGDGLDQVDILIEKLASDFNNRRGVIVTWNPLLDATSREPPCMDMIQFVIRNGRLHMRVIFRSQDMLSAAGANFVGATAFFRLVLEGINGVVSRTSPCGISMGTLTIISLIPHIYKKRDGDEFDLMRKHIFNKKTLGQWKAEIKE
jgi:thymidylate synthase